MWRLRNSKSFVLFLLGCAFALWGKLQYTKPVLALNTDVFAFGKPFSDILGCFFSHCLLLPLVYLNNSLTDFPHLSPSEGARGNERSPGWVWRPQAGVQRQRLPNLLLLRVSRPRSHLSHFRLSRPFQQRTTSEWNPLQTVLARTLEVRPVGDRLAACCGCLRGSEQPGTKFLTSFQKVNSQKGAADVAWRPSTSMSPFSCCEYFLLSHTAKTVASII